MVDSMNNRSLTDGVPACYPEMMPKFRNLREAPNAADCVTNEECKTELRRAPKMWGFFRMAVARK